MIDTERFVRVWQESGTLGAVCARTRLARGSAQVKAAKLRKRGVPLKMMSARGAVAAVSPAKALKAVRA